MPENETPTSAPATTQAEGAAAESQKPTEPTTAQAAAPSEPAKPEAEVPKAEAAAGESKTETTEEAKEQKEGAPEKYDLKLPEGSQMDPSRLEKIASVAKERGYTQAQAEELLKTEHEAIASFVDFQRSSLKTQAEGWVTELMNDKEVGGEGFKKNAEIVHRMVEKYAPDDLKVALEETGLGNHPGLFRMLSRIAKNSKEDSFVQPGTPAKASKSAAEIMYPEQNQ